MRVLIITSELPRRTEGNVWIGHYGDHYAGLRFDKIVVLQKPISESETETKRMVEWLDYLKTKLPPNKHIIYGWES